MAGNILGELLYKISADTTGLNNGINASSGKVQGFGNKLAGMIPTALIIAAAAAAGKAVLKLGTDAVETESKFGVVFSSVGEQAALAVAELNKSYGMARLTAQEMLSSTGDILSGFGFNQSTALSFSTNIAKISTDIASFKNVQGGAAAVSEAVTKAMLGEREMLKTLGIAILEEDVKTQMLKESKAGMVYESERQAKAAATYNLILEKSANAQGDFARTSQSNANQIRVFSETLKDAGATIGKELQPAIGSILQSLNQTFPKFIAFINPMLPLFNKIGDILGKAVNIVGELFEALGPVVKIMAVIVDQALNIADNVITVVGDAIEKGNEYNETVRVSAESLLKVYEKTGEASVNAAQDAQIMAYQLQTASTRGKDLKTEIEKISEKTGYSVEQVTKYAESLGYATAERKKELELIQDALKLQLIQSHIQTVYINAGKAANQAALDSAKALATQQIGSLDPLEEKFLKMKAANEQLVLDQKKLHELGILENTVAQQKLDIEEQIKTIREGVIALIKDGGSANATGTKAEADKIPILEEQLALLNQIDEKKEEVESEDSLSWWDEYKKSIDDAASSVFTLGDAMGILGKAGNDALKSIGENLVTGGDLWGSLKDIAVNAIADILDGLGAQLGIMVVTESLKLNFIGAGLALAGSIAAYAGAAYVRSLSDNPEGSGAGNQATPPAASSSDPSRSYNTGSERTPIIIQMDDGSKLSAFINKQIKQGKIVTA